MSSENHQIIVAKLQTSGAIIKVICNGHEMTLHEGDEVYLNDRFISSNIPQTALLLNNGNLLELPENEALLLDDIVLITGRDEQIDPENWDIQDKLLDEKIKMDEESHITLHQKRHYEDSGFNTLDSSVQKQNNNLDINTDHQKIINSDDKQSHLDPSILSSGLSADGQ